MKLIEVRRVLGTGRTIAATVNPSLVAVAGVITERKTELQLAHGDSIIVDEGLADFERRWREALAEGGCQTVCAREKPYDPTAPPIHETLAAIGAQVPLEEWDKVAPQPHFTPAMRSELVRQLVDAAHHHYVCLKCGTRYQAEHEQVVCSNCGATLHEDRAMAAEHYHNIIDAALQVRR